MASETPYPGLVGVSDAGATISGVLTGAGIKVSGPEGVAVGSGDQAIAVAMWFGYLNEAARMLEQEYATRDDIDAAMQFGCGYPIGPLRQLDSIGLDTAVAVLGALHEASGDSRHIAAKSLVSRVENGETGAVSGQGFYTYALPGTETEVVNDTATAENLATPRNIARVGVVGTGTMATGIVEVFAKSGYDVIYVARSDEKVARVQAALQKSLGRAVDKGKLSSADRDAVLARVTGTTDHADLSVVDIVVEAIVEELAIKRELFETLDRVCKPGAILATTTSSLSVGDLAAVTSRPADVVGMHFFNPAPIMKLVEVVSPKATAPEVTSTVVELCRNVGKHPVQCGDRAGFIVNFLLFPYLNDAVRARELQLIAIEPFDELIKTWQSLPLGPFSLLDVVGNDVSLAIVDTIRDAFDDRCYSAAPLLRQTVAAGKLGRKTGEGFLTY